MVKQLIKSNSYRLNDKLEKKTYAKKCDFYVKMVQANVIGILRLLPK